MTAVHFLGSSLPGQFAKAQTRMPPSQSVFFSPRKGAFSLLSGESGTVPT
jgi:hypothetical protein